MKLSGLVEASRRPRFPPGVPEPDLHQTHNPISLTRPLRFRAFTKPAFSISKHRAKSRSTGSLGFSRPPDPSGSASAQSVQHSLCGTGHGARMMTARPDRDTGGAPGAER